MPRVELPTSPRRRDPMPQHCQRYRQQVPKVEMSTQIGLLRTGTLHLGSRVTWYFPQTIASILSTREQKKALTKEESMGHGSIHPSGQFHPCIACSAACSAKGRLAEGVRTREEYSTPGLGRAARRRYGAGVGNRPSGLPRWV